jgi:hypothetical protein
MSDSPADLFLASLAPAVRALAVRAREVVKDELPDDVLETVDGNDIGFGWSTGYTGLVCVISVYSRWVNLGIVDGRDLPDPHGLLQGSGKRHRYIRLSALADLDRPGLRELLRAAAARARQPNGADR